MEFDYSLGGLLFGIVTFIIGVILESAVGLVAKIKKLVSK